MNRLIASVMLLMCLILGQAVFTGTAQAQSFDCEDLIPGSALWYEEGCGDAPDPGTTSGPIKPIGSGGSTDEGFNALNEFCRNAPAYTHPIQIILALLDAGEITLEEFNELAEIVEMMQLPSDPLVWASIDWLQFSIDDPTNAGFWQWFAKCVAVGYIPDGFPGPKEDEGPRDEV